MSYRVNTSSKLERVNFPVYNEVNNGERSKKDCKLLNTPYCVLQCPAPSPRQNLRCQKRHPFA